MLINYRSYPLSEVVHIFEIPDSVKSFSFVNLFQTQKLHGRYLESSAFCTPEKKVEFFWN